MNLIGKMSLIALLLWTIFINHYMLLYYTIILTTYTLFYCITKKGSYPGVRRKIAISTWSKIGDPAIAIELLIDLTKMNKFLKEYNQKYNETRLTLQLVTIAAMA